MNRSQLAFVVLVNAAISLVIALAVVWLFEMRRPDPAELAGFLTSGPAAVLAPTPTPGDVTVLAPADVATPETLAAGAGEPAVQVDEQTSAGDETVHIVEVGESLGSIAARYGLSIETIVQANNLTNPDFVFSGQRLLIPGTAADAVAGVAAPEGSVQILEVEAAGDLAQEAVLIANESNSPFNLTNWQLAREGGPTYTFGNVQLFPGSSVRVYSAAGQDDSIKLYWGQPAAVWTAGSRARLLNAAGVEVDTVTVEQ